MKFVDWNVDGWKTGVCSVGPRGQPYSLLHISNNTCVQHSFTELKDRYNLLYRKKAHVHHYLQVNAMEECEFDEALLSLDRTIGGYQDLEQDTRVVDRLQMV